MRAPAPALPARTALRDAGLSRAKRLRATAPAIVQTALAASLAWLVAMEIVGHAAPFFAPVAAVVALGIVVGQRARRAAELVFGVALGVAVADALVIALGSGTAQIGLVVALAMIAAVALGGSRVVVGQAASSAVLVATIEVPTDFDFARPVDALVAMRDTESAVAAFVDATAVGVETARFSPLRRRERTVVTRYAIAAPEIDIAIRNGRVLARGIVRAVDLEAHVPPETDRSVRDLAAAVRAVRRALEDPGTAVAARGAALDAAARATLALERTSNLSVSVVIGQVRSTATDLLRALGMTQDAAAEAIRSAATGAALAEDLNR